MKSLNEYFAHFVFVQIKILGREVKVCFLIVKEHEIGFELFKKTGQP